MVSVYKDDDYLSAHKQKQTIFRVFMAITFIYLAFCIAWWIYYIGLPYKHEDQTLVKVMIYVASALYTAFVFPYMSIKYGRSRKYCKMLFYVSEGMKVEECNYFYCFREKSLQKDNIDVVGCVFETWNKKKQEWMEREAYFDPEKPMPNFGVGDLVRYVCQSNFIVQYEILQRHAYDFEEYYEDEEYEEAENEESVETENTVETDEIQDTQEKEQAV